MFVVFEGFAFRGGSKRRLDLARLRPSALTAGLVGGSACPLTHPLVACYSSNPAPTTACSDAAHARCVWPTSHAQVGHRRRILCRPNPMQPLERYFQHLQHCVTCILLLWLGFGAMSGSSIGGVANMSHHPVDLPRLRQPLKTGVRPSEA